MNVFVLKMIFAFIASLSITFRLVPFLCSLAFRLQFVDVPDGKIKTHTKTTPYLGGVAVYIGFIFAASLTLPVYSDVCSLLIGSTILLIIGLIDDLIVLAWYQKLLGQLVAVACFLKAGFYLKEEFFYNFWNIPISCLWILSIINAFNLVDVMDGLASTLAIGASSTFLVLALYFQLPEVALLLVAFIGALLGFLWYNRPNAVIYLGDAGSLFIGGFLATIPFLFSWSAYNQYGFLTPMVILAIPLLELASLIVIRIYKRIPVYLGSPDHFAHYLLRKGWGKTTILEYVFFLSILLFVSSFLFATNYLSLFLLLGLGMLFLLFWVIILFCFKC